MAPEFSMVYRMVFIFMCTGVLFVCMSMYCVPLRKPEQGDGSPGTGLTDGYIFALILIGDRISPGFSRLAWNSLCGPG